MGADYSAARSSGTGHGIHGQESGPVNTKDAHTSEARKLLPQKINERTMNEQKVYMDGTVAIWTKFQDTRDRFDVFQQGPIVYSLREDYHELRQEIIERGGFKDVKDFKDVKAPRDVRDAKDAKEARGILRFALYTRGQDFTCVVDESNLTSVLRFAKGAAPGDVIMYYRGEKKEEMKGR